jgi:hypothetical protein
MTGVSVAVGQLEKSRGSLQSRELRSRQCARLASQVRIADVAAWQAQVGVDGGGSGGGLHHAGGGVE